MVRVDLQNGVNQSENPKLSFKDGTFKVEGYQTFNINKLGLHNPKRKLLKKSTEIKKIIKKNQKNCHSLLDVGCSQGYYSFYANFKNYRVTSIEQDPFYFKQVKKINTKLGFNINFRHNNFSSLDDTQYDIVLFLAVIHWIYYSIKKYNTFHKILTKLCKITKRILIIEWVSEKDDAIQSTDKSKNKSYSTLNFISELKKMNFKKIIKKKSNNKHRTLFICYKG